MTEILKEQIQLINKEGKNVLTKHYEFALSEEEIKKFKENLKQIVETCNEELKKCDNEHIELAVKIIEEKAQKEFEIKKDAVANFEKYKRETIKKFKENAHKEFLELNNFINPEVFNKYKAMLVDRTVKEIEAKKEKLQYQLKEHEPLLTVYEEFENGN